MTSHEKKQSFYKVVFVPKNSSQFHVFQVGEACIEYIENPGGKHVDTSSVLTFSFDFHECHTSLANGVFWCFLTFSVENQRFLWLQRIAEAKEPTKACPHTASWEPFHSKTTDSQCHPAGMSLFLSIYLYLYIYIFIYSYIFLTYVYIYICISISTLRLFIRIVYKRTLPLALWCW